MIISTVSYPKTLFSNFFKVDGVFNLQLTRNWPLENIGELICGYSDGTAQFAVPPLVSGP